MLPSNRRLNRESFKSVQTSRLVVSNKFGSLRFSHSPTSNRFSVVIPKALLGAAVKRNTLRRFLYISLEGVTASLQGIFYLRKVGNPEEVSKGLHELISTAEHTLKTSKPAAASPHKHSS